MMKDIILLMKIQKYICLVDNLFIYKISENILGFGILPDLTDKNDLTIFKVQFLIILDESYNIESEIQELIKHQNLENYLIYRKINFQNSINKRLNIYDDVRKIGFFYNCGNFEINTYMTRTKEGILEMINQMK